MTGMKIAIVGGTGFIGEGLALRWARNHEILIGSRDPNKARKAAPEYVESLSCRGISSIIKGYSNEEAITEAEIVVISVPYESVPGVLGNARPFFKDQVVVSLVVPMKKNDYYEYTPPPQGSAALEMRDILPTEVKIVSAYHNVSAKKLCNLDLEIEGDVVVCGDDDDAKKMVMSLTREIRNLRPFDGGPLRSSYMIEALTPFLLNLGKRNGMRDLGVKFV